jgi:hypothetical protein
VVTDHAIAHDDEHWQLAVAFSNQMHAATIQHATCRGKLKNEVETSVRGELTAKKRIESRLFLGGFDSTTTLARGLQNWRGYLGNSGH